MTDMEKVIGAGDNQDAVLSAKKSGHASLLDSGEDFEMLDDDDVDDDPPPLEDAGGGKKTKAEEPRVNETEEPRVAETVGALDQTQVEEWLDVLGMIGPQERRL